MSKRPEHVRCLKCGGTYPRSECRWFFSGLSGKSEWTCGSCAARQFSSAIDAAMRTTVYPDGTPWFPDHFDGGQDE